MEQKRRKKYDRDFRIQAVQLVERPEQCQPVTPHRARHAFHLFSGHCFPVHTFGILFSSMRSSLFSILSLIFACTALFSQTLESPKPKIAVMDFEPRGISQFEAASLSDRFRSELIATRAFDVMERNQMDLVLKEQGFQQTGACSEASCIVEVGQLIAVQQMATGSIGKVGSIYSIEVKILDVGTGQIVKTVSEDCDCPIEHVLLTVMKRVAQKLAGMQVENQSAAIQIQKGNAGLFVKSTPSGAKIYIDGKLRDGRTPLTLQELMAGSHEVRVEKDTLESVRNVTLSDNQVAKVDMTLALKKTVVSLNTEPGEAEVYLNDSLAYGKRPLWTTPLITDTIIPGTYRLIIFKEGYALATQTMQIKPYSKNTYSFDLDPASAELAAQQKKFLKNLKYYQADQRNH